MKQLAATILERLGIGTGSRDGVELKGFRPYSVVRKPKGLDFEWDANLPYFLKHVQGNIVIDAGATAHAGFGDLLMGMGFHVMGIDLVKPQRAKWQYIHATVWRIPLPDRIADTIVAPSLLEHLGLECYGQPAKPDADYQTILEFQRLLKPGGVLLLQVPYGMNDNVIKHRGHNFYRVYTDSSLWQLLAGTQLCVEDMAYMARRAGGWVAVGKSVADKVRVGGTFPPCLCLAKLRKV